MKENEKIEIQEEIESRKTGGRFRSFIGDLPLFSKIFYIVAAVSALLFAAYIISEPFADFFNRHVSSALRALLAYITNVIPFSLAEFGTIMIPVIFVVLILHASKKYCDSWRSVGIYCTCVLSVLSLAFSVFAIGFAPGYHGSTLEKKLGLERRAVSAQELYETAIILAEHVNEEARQVGFIERGFSVMPYTVEQMSDELVATYNSSVSDYPFLQRLVSRVKPIMLSEAMSYTHITGVYTFYTGEANINVAFPDYTIPYTAAHELAHQRGVAREDEANFVAFLICERSEYAYTRYSAYLNMYEYVASALRRADYDLYMKVTRQLCTEAKFEMLAFSQFFEKYQDSTASEVSETINNTYLTIQGTPGTVSYGMVVELAVAYYRD